MPIHEISQLHVFIGFHFYSFLSAPSSRRLFRSAFRDRHDDPVVVNVKSDIRDTIPQDPWTICHRDLAAPFGSQPSSSCVGLLSRSWPWLNPQLLNLGACGKPWPTREIATIPDSTGYRSASG